VGNDLLPQEASVEKFIRRLTLPTGWNRAGARRLRRLIVDEPAGPALHLGHFYI